MLVPLLIHKSLQVVVVSIPRTGGEVSLHVIFLARLARFTRVFRMVEVSESLLAAFKPSTEPLGAGCCPSYNLAMSVAKDYLVSDTPHGDPISLIQSHPFVGETSECQCKFAALNANALYAPCFSLIR